MAEYKLYVDSKQTVWNREWFQVKANSLDEAIKQCLDYSVDPYYSEELYDTIEEMTPEENGNCSTIEVYQSDGKQVYNNKPVNTENNSR